MHWMQTVTDSYPKAMEKNRNTPTVFLVAFKPEAQHQNRESANHKFIGNIDGLRRDGNLATRNALPMADNSREERPQSAPLSWTTRWFVGSSVGKRIRALDLAYTVCCNQKF
jgi:hypothetical protein